MDKNEKFSFFRYLFGALASVLVFTDYFKTPPLAILFFSVLGIIAGLFSLKLAKTAAIVGLILSTAALVYLVVLFAGLAV